MTITSINIDKDKLERVKAITGSNSAKDAVDRALDAVINSSMFDPDYIADMINSEHSQTMRDLADR